MTPDGDRPRDDEFPAEEPQGSSDEPGATEEYEVYEEEHGADEGSGFTEEFNQIEAELDAELDGLGAEHFDDEHDAAAEDDASEWMPAASAGEATDEWPIPEERDEDEVETGEADDADAVGDAVVAEAPDDVEAEAQDGGEEEPAGEEEAEEGAEGEPEAEAEADAEAEEPEGEDAEAPGPGDTVETDTVGAADREAAQEAALAGLRARAGENEAWDSATEHEVVREPAAVAVADEDGKTPRAKPIWARFLTASLVIIVSVATATSISILVYLTDIAEGLRDNGQFAKFKDQFAAVDGGDPQNILIIGSDERIGAPPGDRRSDTAILLRIDPDKEAISLLSIPRDLKVTIPNHGQDKFNAAYAYGGAKLTLRTVKQLTGIDIHHLVNINFTGFADAVNAIDCVYIDVDRRYFIPPESGIAEIDIEAGYQRMCGYKALQYVRFRHEDNDLVRAARQQDFLREARAQVPPWKLIEDRNELIQIFTDYTTSDIDDASTLLELMETLIAARNAQLHEVHFPAQLGETYVTAGTKEIKETIAVFLGEKGPASDKGDDADKPKGDGGKKGGGKKGGKKKPPKPSQEGPAMEDASASAQEYATKIAMTRTKSGKRMLDFPIFYPTRLVPGSVITEASRAFPIDGPGDDVYHGYKFSVRVPGSTFGTGVPYEYYGVSGTDWKDPPILKNPSEKRQIDGRTYQLYYDGDRLRLVGWHDKHGNSYWVTNSLSQSLSEGQMLSIATSVRQYD